MTDEASIARTGTSQPHFFDDFPMRRVGSDTIDADLDESGTPVTILFLWGRNCPNCDVAKTAMLRNPARFRWPEASWLECNVYDDMPMATRFSLHGAPTFLLFHGKRPLGRMTSWPGAAAFTQAVQEQIGRHAT